MSTSTSDDAGGAATADRSVSSRLAAAVQSVTAESASLSKHMHPAAANAHRLQLLTRKLNGFSELEAALPDRSSFVGGGAGGDTRGGAAALSLSPSSLLESGGRLLKSVSQASAQSSRVADLLSYLGPHNPVPLPITEKDSVWLLDNIAYVNPKTGEYQAEFVVAVMAQHPTCRVVDAVRAVADKLGRGAEDDAALKTIEERIMPFLQDVLPGRQVVALHGGGGDDKENDKENDGGDDDDVRLLFGPGGRNGLSSDTRQLPIGGGWGGGGGGAIRPGTLVTTRAEVPAGVDGILQQHTFYTSREQQGGWGVISDIDDTIKLTQTSDPIGILQKTFVDPPTPITGMPELYKSIHQTLGDAAPFFYLSASPYNLYPFLHGFRRQFYPHGMLVLRDATLMSVSGLLSTLTVGTQAYKVDRMHKIHGWLPHTKFVCVGDSTQSDPEAYGEIYRTFPGWVGLIMIRKVTDIAALGTEEKNAPERFEKAFEGVPKSVWHVFEEPSECYALVQQAVGGEGEAGGDASAAASPADAGTDEATTAS